MPNALPVPLERRRGLPGKGYEVMPSVPDRPRGVRGQPR